VASQSTMVVFGNIVHTADKNKPASDAVVALFDVYGQLLAPKANPTFTGTVNGITKAMVGLGNVDNISDSNKPISTATQGALDLKAPLASPTFTGIVSGITKSMVGLGNVENTSDTDKQISTATQGALDLKADKSTTYTKDDVNTKFFKSNCKRTRGFEYAERTCASVIK